MFEAINGELIAARPYFKAVNPGPFGLFTGRAAKVAKAAGLSITSVKTFRKWRKGTEVSTLAGEAIGGKITRKLAAPASKQVKALHLAMPNIEAKDPFRKNGMGARSWYTTPGRHQLVIIYHDANRAGKHIDVHIGRMSVIYKVKPELAEQLRFNREGYLTEDSKKLIVDHVKWEINNGSRVPQNLDHSITNARATWVGGDPEGKSYGDGVTRQVVSESTVDVIKAHKGGPIEVYAPLLNPHRGTYLYEIYPGDGKSAPILIWGARTNQPPKLEDRLHLKMVAPEKINTIEADWTTATAKYDGSSCYVVITNKGTTVWSPRTSVRTGERIEYTHKLDGVAHIKSDETVVAMGELLFVREGRYPWSKDEYLPCASGSGILNANEVLPKGVRPEIRLYRVDRVGRTRTGDLDFWSNRELQERVSDLDPQRLKVVELMAPKMAEEAGFEGVVVVPMVSYEDELSASVNEAYKVKWTMDPHDWQIDRVDFRPGEKGGQAGVVHCTSLESGKSFKLGPSQVGNRELTDDMMMRPEAYEGTVLKVASRRGHEGRAAKVIMVHDDKGSSAA